MRFCDSLIIGSPPYGGEPQIHAPLHGDENSRRKKVFWPLGLCWVEYPSYWAPFCSPLSFGDGKFRRSNFSSPCRGPKNLDKDQFLPRAVGGGGGGGAEHFDKDLCLPHGNLFLFFFFQPQIVMPKLTSYSTNC